MRAFTALDTKLYGLRGSRKVLLKVVINGTEVTWLNYQDWVEEVNFGGTLDQPLTTADLRVKRDLTYLSLAPMNAQSKLNMVGGVFTPIIVVDALVVISTAVVPEGCDRATADALNAWQEVFRGRIDTWDESSNPMTIRCRDISCEVADLHAERQYCYAIGKQCFGVDVWSPGAEAKLGDQVVPSQLPELGTARSVLYECTTAGTCGTDEPAWPAGGTVADGSAVWTAVAWSPYAWTGSTSYALGDVVKPNPDNGHWYLGVPLHGATSGTSGSSQPTWPTTVGGDVTDGGMRWIMLPDNTDGGLSVELILFGIMRDHVARVGVSGIPYVWTPVSPGYWRNPFIVAQAPLLEILRNVAMEIGWDVRLKWDPNANPAHFPNWNNWRLCFAVPDRAKTVPDFTLTSDEYSELPRVESSVSTVRNVIAGQYSDPTQKWSDDVTPKRFNVQVEDASSIGKYRRRWMGVSAALTNNVNSEAEMLAVLNAALSDLKDPLLEADVVGPYRWNVEHGDLVRLAGNWTHFTGDQDLAVYSVQHTLSNSGACTTRLGLRGKPSIGVMRWHEQATGPGLGRPGRGKRPAGPLKDSIFVSNTIGGARVTFKPPLAIQDGRGASAMSGPGDWAESELHVYSAPGTAPDATTLVARSARATSFTVNNLRGTTTRYGRIVLVDGAGNRSPPSAEFEITPQQAVLGEIDDGLKVAFCANQPLYNPLNPIWWDFNSSMSGVVQFSEELFDDGDGYDPATGVFTVPVTGVYEFYARAWGQSQTPAQENVFDPNGMRPVGSRRVWLVLGTDDPGSPYGHIGQGVAAWAFPQSPRCDFDVEVRGFALLQEGSIVAVQLGFETPPADAVRIYSTGVAFFSGKRVWSR